MAIVTVNAYIDIDMDDINTNNLVEEICRRLKRAVGKNPVSDKEKNELKESFANIGKVLSEVSIESIRVKTLDDKIKCEHLAFVFNKYSVQQIQTLLP